MWDHYKYQQLLQQILLRRGAGGSWIISLCRDNSSTSPGQINFSWITTELGIEAGWRSNNYFLGALSDTDPGAKRNRFSWNRIPRVIPVPCSVLQCRGTSSAPLESCQLQ